MAGFERALFVAALIAFAGAIVAFALVRQEAATRSRRRWRWRPERAREDTPAGRRAPAGDRRGRDAVFATGSYSGATTAEIAREAGISEPILYRHFASKRELYFACLEDAWGSLRRRSTRSSQRARRRERGHGDRRRRSSEFHASGGVKPVDALDPGADRGGRGPGDPRATCAGSCATCTTSSPTRSGARRRREACRPTAIPRRRRGSSSAAALLLSFADRLGGLLDRRGLRRDRGPAPPLAHRHRLERGYCQRTQSRSPLNQAGKRP